MKPIKVLIVDDSSLVRQTFSALLESDPEIQVIGTAGDPYIAVHKIQKGKPDVITLDIEMPKMDGLTFLKKIMAQAPMPVVVISNQTVKGAEVALKALEYGAVNVLTKPKLGTETQQEESRITLIDSIRSAYFARKFRGKAQSFNRPDSAERAMTHSKRDDQDGRFIISSNSMIAIGASTGGTEAIKRILDQLPPKMPPILMVQHMPEKFTASFAKRLNESCQLHVKEAENNELVQANTVYVAPGNYHMSIQKVSGRNRIKISQGDLVNRHRPSVNVLFDSVADIAGKKAVGIILTGMGDDGASSLLKMKQNGAYTIAQDENTCVVFGMPQKAIQMGGVEDIVPLEKIPSVLCDHLQRSSKV